MSTLKKFHLIGGQNVGPENGMQRTKMSNEMASVRAGQSARIQSGLCIVQHKQRRHKSHICIAFRLLLPSRLEHTQIGARFALSNVT